MVKSTSSQVFTARWQLTRLQKTGLGQRRFMGWGIISNQHALRRERGNNSKTKRHSVEWPKHREFNRILKYETKRLTGELSNNPQIALMQNMFVKNVPPAAEPKENQEHMTQKSFTETVRYYSDENSSGDNSDSDSECQSGPPPHK